MGLVSVVDDGGGVRTITLNRPERANALGSELLEAFELTVAETAAWSGQVVVIEGAGRNFCAGADLRERAADGAEQPWPSRRINIGRWNRLIDGLENLPQTTVARLHGHVVGAGLVVALGCDLRVGEPDAVLRLPELQLGLPLTMGGVPRLVREVGLARAREAVLTGRPIVADEAREWGLVHRVGDSRIETSRLIDELMTVSPGLQSMTKQALRALGQTVLPVELSWADPDLYAFTRYQTPDNNADVT